MDGSVEEVQAVTEDQAWMNVDGYQLDSEDVQMEMEGVRARHNIVSRCNPFENNFYVQVMGGVWSLEHKGHVVDSFVGRDRAGFPTDWCKNYNIQTSMRFSIRCVGEAAADALAHLFCDRCEMLFRMFYMRGSPTNFVYPPRAAFDYTEPRGDYAKVQAAGLVARRRLLNVRAVYPR